MTGSMGMEEKNGGWDSDSFYKGIMIETMKVRRAQKEKLKRGKVAQGEEETAKKVSGEARKIGKA